MYLQREYGRAAKGKKVEDIKRGRRFSRTNIIGGLCSGQYLGNECYSHSTNGEFFLHWFEKNLLPEVPHGYTIIMDNATFHPKEKLKMLAELVGVKLLFLPPYSPDLNPIEKSWANLKCWLRDNLSSFLSFDFAVSNYFCY